MKINGALFFMALLILCNCASVSFVHKDGILLNVDDVLRVKKSALLLSHRNGFLSLEDPRYSLDAYNEYIHYDPYDTRILGVIETGTLLQIRKIKYEADGRIIVIARVLGETSLFGTRVNKKKIIIDKFIWGCDHAAWEKVEKGEGSPIRGSGQIQNIPPVPLSKRLPFTPCFNRDQPSPQPCVPYQGLLLRLFQSPIWLSDSGEPPRRLLCPNPHPLQDQKTVCTRPPPIQSPWFSPGGDSRPLEADGRTDRES